MESFAQAWDAFKSQCVRACLIAVAVFVGVCGVFITGLYLLKYVDPETPEMVAMRCILGADLPECPDTEKEMALLRKEKAELEKKLAGLMAIEKSVDEITLFQTFSVVGSSISMTVGTVYKKLTNFDGGEEAEWFCYLSLGNGALNESRNLYFRSRQGDVSDIDMAALSQAGVGASAFRYAKSQCKPLLVGGK